MEYSSHVEVKLEFSDATIKGEPKDLDEKEDNINERDNFGEGQIFCIKSNLEVMPDYIKTNMKDLRPDPKEFRFLHYLCIVCGENFSARQLTQHAAHHCNGNDTSCQFCHKKFKTTIFLHAHYCRHVLKVFKRIATRGKLKYRTSPSVRQHPITGKKASKPLRDRLLLCPNCSLKGVKKGDLYQCTLCFKIFTKSEFVKERVNLSARRYALQKRLHPKNFECNFCGKIFSAKPSIYYHIKHCHLGKPLKAFPRKNKKRYLCEICGKMIVSSPNFANHKSIHANYKRYQCLQCGKAFHSSSNLKQHGFVHGGQRKYYGKKKPLNKGIYICEYCGVLNSYKYNHHAHVKCHFQEGFTCAQCGKTFLTKERMKIHWAVHSKETTYKCDFCPKKFRFYSSRKKHLLTHSEEKPFQCHICLKKFHKKTHMESHIRTHTGKKPYQCHVCGKLFRTRAIFLAHNREVHSSLVFSCTICNKEYNLSRSLRAHVRNKHKV